MTEIEKECCLNVIRAQDRYVLKRCLGVKEIYLAALKHKIMTTYPEEVPFINHSELKELVVEETSKDLLEETLKLFK